MCSIQPSDFHSFISLCLCSSGYHPPPPSSAPQSSKQRAAAWRRRQCEFLQSVAIDYVRAILSVGSRLVAMASQSSRETVSAFVASSPFFAILMPVVTHVVYAVAYEPEMRGSVSQIVPALSAWMQAVQGALNYSASTAVTASAASVSVPSVASATSAAWSAASANSQKSQSQSAQAAPLPQSAAAALFPTVMLESAHAYGAHVSQASHIRIPGASHILVEFDRRCCTERGRDFLEIKATNQPSGAAASTSSASGSSGGSSAAASLSGDSGASASVAGSQPLSLHGSARHWPRAPVVFAGDSGTNHSHQSVAENVDHPTSLQKTNNIFSVHTDVVRKITRKIPHFLITYLFLNAPLSICLRPHQSPFCFARATLRPRPWPPGTMPPPACGAFACFAPACRYTRTTPFRPRL